MVPERVDEDGMRIGRNACQSIWSREYPEPTQSVETVPGYDLRITSKKSVKDGGDGQRLFFICRQTVPLVTKHLEQMNFK